MYWSVQTMHLGSLPYPIVNKYCGLAPKCHLRPVALGPSIYDARTRFFDCTTVLTRRAHNIIFTCLNINYRAHIYLSIHTYNKYERIVCAS